MRNLGQENYKLPTENAVKQAWISTLLSGSRANSKKWENIFFLFWFEFIIDYFILFLISIILLYVLILAFS